MKIPILVVTTAIKNWCSFKKYTSVWIFRDQSCWSLTGTDIGELLKSIKIIYFLLRSLTKLTSLDILRQRLRTLTPKILNFVKNECGNGLFKEYCFDQQVSISNALQTFNSLICNIFTYLMTSDLKNQSLFLDYVGHNFYISATFVIYV